MTRAGIAINIISNRTTSENEKCSVVTFVAGRGTTAETSGKGICGHQLLLPTKWLQLRWLQPHLRGPLRVAVPVYVLAIASMAALAAGAAARNEAPLLFAGAALFCASDLAVARERFVKTGFVNKSWGLPFYFLGQGLLAASVAPPSP